MQFQKFGKIARLSRECIITEKIDGTNGQINIVPLKPTSNIIKDYQEKCWNVIKNGYFYYGVVPGSRNGYITIKKDNFGFAKWVHSNAEELLKLGVGTHYGEWWGEGIQRSYNLKGKKFSLFNVTRWGCPDLRPSCCDVVPLLYSGKFTTYAVDNTLSELCKTGSKACLGFMKPEGVIIYHNHGGYLFKKTIENDEKPKGEAV